MYRGTTPTHTFKVPIDTSLVKSVKIIYSQRDKEILVKRKNECTFEGNAISTRLTQEDTFKFDGTALVTIQIRVLTVGDDALISHPIVRSVGKCLDEEVLV